MKIKFKQRHAVVQGDGRGPVYNAGDVVSFDGPVNETYARKYIARGYAEIYVAPAPEPVPVKTETKSEVVVEKYYAPRSSRSASRR